MENKEEKEVVVKKKKNWIFTLFACIMTAIIVALAMNLGQKASKIVDPDTNSSGSKTEEKKEESNVTTSNDTTASNTATTSITTKDIVGNYDYSTDTSSYHMTLFDDGTIIFVTGSKEHNVIVSERYGSYAITDNIIKVRFFVNNTGTDTDAAIDENINYTFNILDSNTLVVKEKSLFYNNDTSSELKLSKTSSISSTNDVNDRLKNLMINTNISKDMCN